MREAWISRRFHESDVVLALDQDEYPIITNGYDFCITKFFCYNVAA
jgi:hypothetical protein